MARPRKENLDYFPFDVDFFRDKRIKRLRARFGADGIAVYQYILCEIYNNGYYIEYDEDLVLDIADYFNCSEAKTTQIVSCLFNRSLLECILVDQVKVITAKSVQRRYQEAKKGAKRDITVDKGIWLLSKEETYSFIKVRSDESSSRNNEGFSEKNNSKSGKNDTKESKVKESKVKESKVCMSGFSIPCRNGSFELDKKYYTELTHTYPNMNIDDSLNALITYLTAYPDKQGLKSSIKAYIAMWLRDDDLKGRYRKSVPESSCDICGYESTSVIDEFIL